MGNLEVQAHQAEQMLRQLALLRKIAASPLACRSLTTRKNLPVIPFANRLNSATVQV